VTRGLGAIACAALLAACSACGAHSSRSTEANPQEATTMANEAKGSVPPGAGHPPPPNIAPRMVRVRFRIEPPEAARAARITMYGRPVSHPQEFVAGMGSVVDVVAEGYEDFEGTFSPTEDTTLTITMRKR
jgi:hypothetical protein